MKRILCLIFLLLTRHQSAEIHLTFELDRSWCKSVVTCLLYVKSLCLFHSLLLKVFPFSLQNFQLNQRKVTLCDNTCQLVLKGATKEASICDWLNVWEKVGRNITGYHNVSTQETQRSKLPTENPPALNVLPLIKKCVCKVLLEQGLLIWEFLPGQISWDKSDSTGILTNHSLAILQ